MTKDELLQIGIQKRNKQIDLTWEEINQQYGGGFFPSGEALRSWVKNQVVQKKKDDSGAFRTPDFKETFEVKSDGSQISNKLVKISLVKDKDPRFLLEAHGYDPDAWDLINVKATEWTSPSKKQGSVPMYATRISVKPKKQGVSIEEILEAMKDIQPVDIDLTNEEPLIKMMLEVPIFDAHFGISDYDYYKPTQNRIYSKINSRRWEEVLFVIGQDLMHNNDSKGHTANLTKIEEVDMVKAWEDARKFYEPLIKEAVKNSNHVKIMYSPGNHDTMVSWTFVQMMKARFPELQYDDSFEERKVHVFGNNFIGITHGDKARKNLHNIFPVEFPEQWAKANNREIHMGHLHTEDSKDWFGMMVRTLATRNKTDKWHKQQGYVGGHKRFTLFEFSEERLESMHYV